MRISDLSSDVCSSDLGGKLRGELNVGVFRFDPKDRTLKPYTGLQFAAAMSYAIRPRTAITLDAFRGDVATVRTGALARTDTRIGIGVQQEVRHNLRSEEHTSELQSLMRISYAVFCLKKKKDEHNTTHI